MPACSYAVWCWCTARVGGRQEFISAITREKEENERLFALSERKKKVSGVLDPLTRSLKNYEDQEDLIQKIDHMYSRLDIDGSGGACLSCPLTCALTLRSAARQVRRVCVECVSERCNARTQHVTVRAHEDLHTLAQTHAKGLNYEEFRTAIKTFPGASNVNLTHEEYEIITDGGALLDEDGEFDSARFREMMQRELWRCAS